MPDISLLSERSKVGRPAIILTVWILCCIVNSLRLCADFSSILTLPAMLSCSAIVLPICNQQSFSLSGSCAALSTVCAPVLVAALF